MAPLAPAGPHPSKEAVDALFSFAHPLGKDYRGGWLDDSTFTITVLEPAAAAPRLGVTSVSLNASMAVRNSASTSEPAAGIPVELSGDFGSSAPRLLSFEAHGRNAADVVYGAGDEFVLGFSRATDRGGVPRQARVCETLQEEVRSARARDATLVVWRCFGAATAGSLEDAHWAAYRELGAAGILEFVNLQTRCFA